MTAPLTPDTPTPNGGASSTEQTSSAPAPAPTPPPVWRAPENAPAWAKGKTAEEILQQNIQLAEVVSRFNQQGILQQQPAPQAPVQATHQTASFGDEDFLTGAQVKALLQQAVAQVQPAVQQATQAGAQANVGIAMMQFKPEFDRWGPEINSMLANVPLEQRNVDTVKQIVNIVRGNHVDELVAEKVAAASQHLPTTRSNGAAAGQPTSLNNGLNSPHVSDAWKLRANAAGISEREIEDFCRVNEMTPDQFFKQFEKGTFMTAAVSENRFRPVLR